MNTIKKPTKKTNYSVLLAMLNLAEDNGFELGETEVTFDSLRDFINHEVELLDNKAAAAAKRAAAKREEGDALRERIAGVLSTDSFMTINDVVKALGDEDVSAQMVTARLTQLNNLGLVEKDMVSVAASTEGGKSKKLSAYRKV